MIWNNLEHLNEERTKLRKSDKLQFQISQEEIKYMELSKASIEA